MTELAWVLQPLSTSSTSTATTAYVEGAAIPEGMLYRLMHANNGAPAGMTFVPSDEWQVSCNRRALALYTDKGR